MFRAVRWLPLASLCLSGCVLIAGDTGGNACTACDGRIADVEPLTVDCPPGVPWVMPVEIDSICQDESPPDCPDDERAQTARCVPIARGGCADGWPDGEADLYVDPAAMPGGDGSRAAPFASIAEALAAAGSTVALREGTHEACGAVPVARTIVGACGQTLLDATGCTVTLDADVQLFDVTMAGGALEVSAEGSLDLRDARIEALSSAGTVVASASRIGSLTVTGGTTTLNQMHVDGELAVSNASLTANALFAQGGVRLDEAVVGGADWWLVGGAPAFAQAGGEVQLDRVLVSDAERGLALTDAARTVLVDSQVDAASEALVVQDAFAALFDSMMFAASGDAVRVTQGTLDVVRGRVEGAYDVGLLLERTSPVGAATVTLGDVAFSASRTGDSDGVRVRGGVFVAGRLRFDVPGVALALEVSPGDERLPDRGATATVRSALVLDPRVGVDVGENTSLSTGRVRIGAPTEAGVRVAPAGTLIAACLDVNDEFEIGGGGNAFDFDRGSLIDVSEIEVLGAFDCGVRLRGQPLDLIVGENPTPVSVTCGSIQGVRAGICPDTMGEECPETPDGLTQIFFGDTDEDRECR